MIHPPDSAVQNVQSDHGVQSVQNNILNTVPGKETRDKPSIKLERAIQWANEHPQASVRDIATGAGVSIGTAQRAKKVAESE